MGLSMSIEALEAVELLASEVIVNAVLHTDAPCDVAVTRTDERLRVEVTDIAPSLPTPVEVDLERWQEDLHHVNWLRERLPNVLAEQALHADLSRTNLIVLADAVTGVIDFRCATGTPAWELGRAAFDPRTVANSPDWIACALVMVDAYRAENPSLPMAEVRSCARVALLYMLFSFYGATTAEYDLPQEAEADLKQHWSERQTTIRRLLGYINDLEDALDRHGAEGGST
ncbi:phosphotransferase [Streptomyces sp. NPDC054834]